MVNQILTRWYRLGQLLLGTLINAPEEQQNVKQEVEECHTCAVGEKGFEYGQQVWLSGDKIWI